MLSSYLPLVLTSSPLYFRFPHQNSVCIFHHHECHMFYPSHPHGLINQLISGEFLNMYFSPVSCFSLGPTPQYHRQDPVLEHRHSINLFMCRAFCTILLYLPNRYTIYVNNYMFLIIALLHVSMFVHRPQEVCITCAKVSKINNWKHLHT